MRKSYIVLSLILSQALCADTATDTNLTANFGSTGSNGNPLKVTKLDGTNAAYGSSNDWVGSTSYLNLLTDNLTFSFTDTSKTNLIINNGFAFVNKISQDNNSTVQANITITKNNVGQSSLDTSNNALNTLNALVFGSSSTTSTSSYIKLGSNINLKVTSFSKVNVANNLSIASNSTFDVSTIDNVTNDGGIILEGSASKLLVKDTLTNSGTVMMKGGSSIESGASNNLKVISGSGKRGSIIVQGGGATIQTANNILTLKSQDITLRNVVSKDSEGKVSVANSTLTFKNTNGSGGTLTLGEASNSVSITGDIGNTNPSGISNSEIPQGSEIGKLVLSGFTTINATNVSFKNVAVTSNDVDSINLNSGTLGLENTTIAIGDDKIATNVAFGVSGNSTIALTGKNIVSTTGTLTITGTHNFQGDGTLDFVGSSVSLGNGVSSSFALTGSSGSPTIGVSGTISTNEFSLTGLTLQAINSSITNTKMTLSNSTLEAIDSEGNLTNLEITNSGSGTIDIANNSTVTLKGEGIILTEQNINLNDGSDKLTTLTLQAGSNGVTIDGGTSGSTISGKNTTLSNNVLNIDSSYMTIKGKVTLESVLLTVSNDLRIINTESDMGNKGLFLTKNSSDSTMISTEVKKDSQSKFYSLTFASNETLGEGKQAYMDLNGNNATITFQASDFTFQDQNVNLANNTSGTELKLYAYGSEWVDSTFSNLSGGSSPTATLEATGVFTFTNTTFADGSGSKIALYGGSGGVSVSPDNLTLKNVSIDSMLIDNNGNTSKNTLNLSSSEGSITILGSSTISATKFVYGDKDKGEQGIGVDISVGSGNTSGQLTITSDDTSDTFIFGGNLTLNNTASGTTLEITSNSNQAQAKALANPATITEGTLSLEFRGGGVTAIGTSGNTMTLIAKDFKFTNLTESDNTTIISSPFVKVQNTELTLNMNSSNGTDPIDIVGTTYLLGDTTNEAKLKATKGTSNNNESSITLKLHDITATGKASIQSNKIEFSDSNISVSNSGSSNELLLQDVSNSNTLMSGTIASISLSDGNLQFKKNSSVAEITLNASSTITSSGDSSLTLKTIKVGNDSSNNAGLYSLNVSSGTFTLKESTAGTQLGAITLGSESSQGGDGGSFIYQNGTGSTYNDITLKGNITSYGNSSIQAQSFTISAKEDKSKYSISSNGGELKLIAQDSSNPTLSATADISLNSGSLGYYGSDSTLSSLTLSSSSSLSATGDSTLQANGLNLNGASVSASGGTLTLKGISSSTKAGNVSVGDSGILTLKKSNTTLASLTLSEGSKLTLSANVPYVTSSTPLGGGVFGQVIAQSVQFESKSGGLVQISLKTSSASSSSYDDSLFALREGAITLISTENGIQKKSGVASYTNITLDDIVTDTSGLTSITLTPYLDMATNPQGQSIVKNLLLNLSVSQTNVTQLVESIKDSSAKETMTSIINSGNNASILESILQSDNNAFKVGMAEYISSGNTAVVQTSLEYINGAMSSLEDSMFASNKIYELIAMLRTSNVENRMVRGKNPFMAKTRLSSLIRSISGTRYASSDDSLLLEEEESGVNYGELWANFDGAMSFSQEEKGNSSLYGMSAGYDTLLGEQRNYLLGFFASYGYGAYSFNYARNNSHNFGLGLYTRMSFENSEVDIILSQNIGLNHTEIDLGATNSYVAQALKQTLGYNFYTTDIEARYGYVFKVGNEDSPYYFRPFGGINFALIINSSARGDGEAELGIQAMNTYQLSVNVGVEMRKYFGEENYFYLLPILQKGLLNDGAGAKVGFYGAENLQLTPAYNVDTSLSLLLGGVGNVGENIAVSGGVGVKYGFEKKDILTNWNVGIRYKF